MRSKPCERRIVSEKCGTIYYNNGVKDEGNGTRAVDRPAVDVLTVSGWETSAMVLTRENDLPCVWTELGFEI